MHYADAIQVALPAGLHLIVNPDKCHVVESSAEFSPEPADPTLARCVKFHDPAYSSGNAQLWREFQVEQSGTITAQFDVRFKQNNSAFLFRIGNEGSVSLGSSYAMHLIFEGTTPWSTNGSPGVISYQVERSPLRYVNSGLKYEANKWYTVRAEVDVAKKKCRIYFGLRGRPLKEITPYEGQPFIVNPATGETVSSVQKICFATASLNTDPESFVYIDNVRIEGLPEMPSNDIARYRVANRGDSVRLQNAVVTAGTDQMGAPFFYVQDDEPGGAGVR